jgi:hypothetical protein
MYVTGQKMTGLLAESSLPEFFSGHLETAGKQWQREKIIVWSGKATNTLSPQTPDQFWE